MAEKYEGIIAQIKNKGKIEGKIEGRIEERKEIIKKLSKKLSPNTISDLLETDETEIKKILME